MQPTNAAPFNPLDFKKLSQQEQFEAARTMNQKELIAVAGTGVSLETLLKYQGLSDTEIQKRLKDLNPYLAEFSLINQRDNLKATAAEKRSHAEFYAMLEEQSHSPTQAGHKLGDISNLSHEQQIHALAEHFAHGGSTSEALAALGESEEAQRKQDELEEQYRIEHKAELERIAKIKDAKKQKDEQDSFNQRMRQETLPQNKFASAENSKKIAELNNYSKVMGGVYNKEAAAALRSTSTASIDHRKISAKVKNGTATETEDSTLNKIDLSEKSVGKIQDDLENDKTLKTEIIKDYIKNSAAAANKVAAATIVAKGGISKDSISDVKDTEYKSSKAASAEALKTGVVVSKTNDDWSEPDIPKVGSIKVASWQKKNAEAKAPAPDKPSRLTA